MTQHWAHWEVAVRAGCSLGSRLTLAADTPASTLRLSTNTRAHSPSPCSADLRARRMCLTGAEANALITLEMMADEVRSAAATAGQGDAEQGAALGRPEPLPTHKLAQLLDRILA